jgi:hypothetical protein
MKRTPERNGPEPLTGAFVSAHNWLRCGYAFQDPDAAGQGERKSNGSEMLTAANIVSC